MICRLSSCCATQRFGSLTVITGLAYFLGHFLHCGREFGLYNSLLLYFVSCTNCEVFDRKSRLILLCHLDQIQPRRQLI